MPIRQVTPHKHFPSRDSRALATLRFSPEELAARYGLEFEEDYDDLDCFKLAAIALEDGNQAWLMRHRGNPEPGTDVYVDSLADLAATREQLERILGVTDADFTWFAPGAETKKRPAEASPAQAAG